jgi:hypothetical protein
MHSSTLFLWILTTFSYTLATVAAKSFTLADVKAQGLTILDNNVYDLKNFASLHIGGSSYITVHSLFFLFLILITNPFLLYAP